MVLSLSPTVILPPCKSTLHVHPLISSVLLEGGCAGWEMTVGIGRMSSLKYVLFCFFRGDRGVNL